MGNFGPKIVNAPPPPDLNPIFEEYMLIAQTQPAIERYRIVRHAPEIVDGRFLFRGNMLGVIVPGILFLIYVNYAQKHGAHFPAKVFQKEWKKAEDERTTISGEYSLKSYKPSHAPQVPTIEVDIEENK